MHAVAQRQRGIRTALTSLKTTMEKEGRFTPEFAERARLFDEETKATDLAQRLQQEARVAAPRARADEFTAEWRDTQNRFPTTSALNEFDQKRAAMALAGVAARHLDVETDGNIRAIAAALRGVRPSEAGKEIALLVKELAVEGNGIASPVAILRKRLEGAA